MGRKKSIWDWAGDKARQLNDALKQRPSKDDLMLRNILVGDTGSPGSGTVHQPPPPPPVTPQATEGVTPPPPPPVAFQPPSATPPAPPAPLPPAPDPALAAEASMHSPPPTAALPTTPQPQVEGESSSGSEEEAGEEVVKKKGRKQRLMSVFKKKDKDKEKNKDMKDPKGKLLSRSRSHTAPDKGKKDKSHSPSPLAAACEASSKPTPSPLPVQNESAHAGWFSNSLVAGNQNFTSYEEMLETEQRFASSIVQKHLKPGDKCSMAYNVLWQRPSGDVPCILALVTQKGENALFLFENTKRSSLACSPTAAFALRGNTQGKLYDTLDVLSEKGETYTIKIPRNIVKSKVMQHLEKSMEGLSDISEETHQWLPAYRRGGKRWNVAFELLETEERYVKYLKTIVDDYLHPLREKKIVAQTDEVMNRMFLNVEVLNSFHSELFVKMKTQMDSWEGDCNGDIYASQCIGNALTDLFHFLNLYVAYVDGHQAAQTLVRSLLETNQEFRKFCKATESRTNTQSLLSLLIMPVQRIPRYKLLLQELIKSTHCDHPDFESLTKAHKVVSDVALKINESVRSQEESLKMEQWQTSLKYPNLIAPHRRLVKEGQAALMQRHRHITTRDQVPCSVLLFNDILLLGGKGETLAAYNIAYTHVEEAELGTTAPFDLSNAMRIFSEDTDKIVQFADTTERLDWIRAVEGCSDNILNPQQPSSKSKGALSSRLLLGLDLVRSGLELLKSSGLEEQDAALHGVREEDEVGVLLTELQTSLRLVADNLTTRPRGISG